MICDQFFHVHELCLVYVSSLLLEGGYLLLGSRRLTYWINPEIFCIGHLMLISDIGIRMILLIPFAENPAFSAQVSHGCLKYMYCQYKINKLFKRKVILYTLNITSTIVLTPPFRYEGVYVHQGNQKCMWYVKSLLVTVKGDH